MDCQLYHSHKQMNLSQFIYEIHAVRVICVQGQTLSQQLRYPKTTYLVIAQTKMTWSRDSQKSESHNQDMYLEYTDLY